MRDYAGGIFIGIILGKKTKIFVVIVGIFIVAAGIIVLFQAASAADADWKKTRQEIERLPYNISYADGSTKNRALIELCYNLSSLGSNKSVTLELQNVIDPSIAGVGSHEITYSMSDFENNCTKFEVPKNRDVVANVNINYNNNIYRYPILIST